MGKCGLSKGKLKDITSGFKDYDLGKLTDLIETAFGKKLSPDYYSLVNPSHIFLVTNNNAYLGAAILEDSGHGFQYLDKVAVLNKGKGLGGSLLNLVDKNFDSLVWRASPENKINNYYSQMCEGMQKNKDWTVYWKGLDKISIPGAIKYALDKKPTLFYVSQEPVPSSTK